MSPSLGQSNVYRLSALDENGEHKIEMTMLFKMRIQQSVK